MGRRSLLLLAAVLGAAGLAWMTLGSRGDAGRDQGVERILRDRPEHGTVHGVAGLSDAARRASGPTASERDVPRSASAGTVPSASSAPDGPARFDVIVLDDERIPVKGVRGSGIVRSWWRDEERRAAGAWSGAREPINGDVVARFSGAELVSDARGRITVVVSDPARDGALEAEFSLSAGREAPFAPVRQVRVDEGETVTVVLERAGSLDVSVTALAGGVVPHVYRPRMSASGERGVNLNHVDVRFGLVHENGTNEGFGRATAVDATRWTRLPPGLYRLNAYSTGLGPAVPMATLEGLVVEPGRACDDPRLVGWNPFEGHGVMYVDVVGPDGRPPATLEVGYFFPRRGATVSENADYDGRLLPIVGPVGQDAAVFFAAEGTRRSVLDIEPGTRRVVLEESISLQLELVAPPGAQDAPEWIRISKREVGADVPVGAFSTSLKLDGDRLQVTLELPGPGTYVGRSMLEGQTAFSSGDAMTLEPFEFWVEDIPVVRETVQLVRRD